MPSLQDQFSFHIQSGHFEADPHHEVQGLQVDGVKILHGETAADDILVVSYPGSPALSFYNTRGRLIDVDHYLPDHYVDLDADSTDQIIRNLKNADVSTLSTATDFRPELDDILEVGNRSLARGLQLQYGLESTATDEAQFKAKIGFSEGTTDDLKDLLVSKYGNLKAFLRAYLNDKLTEGNGYIHFTPNDNIIITTLNKRSGLAVLIETQDTNGQLLPPSRWLITRTQNEQQLEQALVFRSQDIKDFFEADGYETIYSTDRYRMIERESVLELDSLLDNTNNLLSVKLVNGCYQLLASDRNVIVALSGPREVSIINTHRSVVPGKWTQKIKLPSGVARIRADENLATLFAQLNSGDILVYDATQQTAKEIARLGTFAPGMELDAQGSVIVKHADNGELLKIKTNAPDLEIPGDQQNFTKAFKNLSHLFKGESLFTKTTFAQPLPEVTEDASTKKLPSAVEAARYDFETSVDHMLVDAGQDFQLLLDVQQKIAIARTNIGEELTRVAEEEDILLVGQRLQSTINNIVRASERRVKALVEVTRAQQIIAEARQYREQLTNLQDPLAYRNILNSVRAAANELEAMTTGDVAEIISEFKAIQLELNDTFSRQIAEDGNNLQAFITKEIEQIEKAIDNTHELRQLENILSIHPAAVELLSLLKQPFVLQSIASEQRLSPAGIQSRLHKAVEQRRQQLLQDQAQREAEVNAAKLQLANMIKESIDFFVSNHSGGFSDLELAKTAAYQEILRDTGKLENQFTDVRLARELRQLLERRILERNREDLEKMVAFEGKYAFIQNDPNLFVDLNSTIQQFPNWDLDLEEKKGQAGTFQVIFTRSTDREVLRPGTKDNLEAAGAFQITESESADFLKHYAAFISGENTYEFLDALWEVANTRRSPEDYPQYKPASIIGLLPKETAELKALGCAREKKYREDLERKRKRNVPVITPEFIDETPYFQYKLREFILKAKLQLTTGAGVILLSGPPSTGKSAFLKFMAAVMNREYFEHASDKWQTKNSLVTAIKFGENGPYTTPAGFTKAITTPHSLLNIEEIKEWPEALRKSLNPFFAGSDVFVAPDGTAYKIGENILLCAAANLGAIYRQDDEPFTADFWSRIEVVEYDYSPHEIDRDYYEALHKPRKNSFLTMKDLARDFFDYREAPGDPDHRARYLSEKFLKFLLLPKADEKVKRDNLRHHINQFFQLENQSLERTILGPEEAAKVALRRLRDFQGYSAQDFFDLYDHFINGEALRSARLAKLQTADVKLYEHLRVQILCLRYLEGCLRHLRQRFYSSAGQTEIEGTNREFINAVYLLGLVGS